jgi:hypothetical protein
MRCRTLLWCVCALLMSGCASMRGERSGLVTGDHYVPVKSIVPSMPGQLA